MTNNGFTKTQQAMLDVLADGERHTTRELHACLPDELGPLSNVRRHISAIRKALRPEREGILCVMHQGKFFYQWVKLLHPSQLP